MSDHAIFLGMSVKNYADFLKSLQENPLTSLTDTDVAQEIPGRLIKCKYTTFPLNAKLDGVKFSEDIHVIFAEARDQNNARRDLRLVHSRSIDLDPVATPIIERNNKRYLNIAKCQTQRQDRFFETVRNATNSPQSPSGPR